MEKHCSKCKESKPLTEFNKNKTRSDGYNSFCRVCHNSHSKAYYKENGVKQIKQIKAALAIRRDANREKVLDILKSGCKDCGNKDTRVLDFDHLPGHPKKHNVSSLISEGYSWDIVLAEIQKCEVVCRNCHAIRTIERDPRDHRNKRSMPQELRLAEALPLKETCVGSTPI